jgi:hypothetical protein
MESGTAQSYTLKNRGCFMGTVIYSASPIQAFLGSLGTILLIFVLGIGGLAMAFLQRKQARGTRILMGAVGGFLLIVACAFATFTFLSASNGVQTVTANLDRKTIAQDNCGDNGETCARYVLETSIGTNAYDFNVPQNAYVKAQVNTCYKFSYYPNKGLFTNDTSSYWQINNVARIETADPTTCQ